MRKALFFAGLFLTLTLPLFYPGMALNFFAPFLIVCLYRLPLSKSLWFAALIGLFLDSLSEEQRFGAIALNYTATLFALSFLKQNLFEDSYSTLPLMALLFSLLSAALLLPFASPPFFHAFFLIPLLDASFALLIYTLPGLLFGSPQKSGQEYFLR